MSVLFLILFLEVIERPVITWDLPTLYLCICSFLCVIGVEWRRPWPAGLSVAVLTVHSVSHLVDVVVLQVSPLSAIARRPLVEW